MKNELRDELLRQAQYQDLEVTDLELNDCLNWVTGNCKINGKVAWLPKIGKLEDVEMWVTSCG